MDEDIRLAVTATMDYLTQRSVALILRGTDGGVAIGSSTCVRVGDRFLLATASHNFEGLEYDGQIELVPASELSTQTLPFVARSARTSGDRPEEDIAWIELSGHTVNKNNLKFVSLYDLAPYQKFTRRYGFFIQGYPAASVEGDLVSGRHLDLASTAAMTMMVEASELARNLTAAEMAFEYPPRDERDLPMVAPHPRGISGGGVWWHPRRDESTIWSPEGVRLAGINRAWHKQSNTLYAIKIERWLELVVRDFPEAKEEVVAFLKQTKTT